MIFNEDIPIINMNNTQNRSVVKVISGKKSEITRKIIPQNQLRISLISKIQDKIKEKQLCPRSTDREMSALARLVDSLVSKTKLQKLPKITFSSQTLTTRIVRLDS